MVDWKKLKDDALKNAKDISKKAKDLGQDALEYWAEKLADSKLTLKNSKELNEFVQKSLPTTWKDSKTGESKEFPHQVIVIFWDPDSDFFQDMLFQLPVLSTKAFSQNISVRLADIRMKDLDTQLYQVGDEPTLLVIENLKPTKTLTGEEAIAKLVKKPNLDIQETIDTL